MGINFPNAPTVGQLWPQPATPGVPVWRWDGQAWMTGSADIIGAVRYDAAQTLTAAQKSQARANIDALKKNYVINGAMQVSQENGATVGTLFNYYPVDQFGIFAVGTTVALNIAQVASPTPAGSPNRIRFTVTAADAAVAAGDMVHIRTKIEGLRVADLMFGIPASARTITIQFGVKAPAGTYSVVVLNSANNRSYVSEYVIAGADINTDTVKSVTVPGDITGAWAKDTTTGLEIRWGLMAGLNYQQAAGAWGATDAVGSPNQFNLMGTSTPPNNVFELFDVGLYEGAVAPSFVVPDFVTELQVCKRYWESTFPYGTQPASALGGSAGGYMVNSVQSASANVNIVQWAFKATKRSATPTMTTYNPFVAGSGICVSGSNNYAASAYSLGEAFVAFRDTAGSMAVGGTMSLHAKADARP